MASIQPPLLFNPSSLDDNYFQQVDEDASYSFIASPSESVKSTSNSAILSTEEEVDDQELVELLASSFDFSFEIDSPPASPSLGDDPASSPQSYISVVEAADNYEYPPEAHERLDREIISKTLAENTRPLTSAEKLILSKISALKQFSSEEIVTRLHALTPEFIQNLRVQFNLLSTRNKRKFIHLIEPLPTTVKDYVRQAIAKHYPSFLTFYRA